MPLLSLLAQTTPDILRMFVNAAEGPQPVVIGIECLKPALAAFDDVAGAVPAVVDRKHF